MTQESGSDNAALQPGTRLGRYEIVELLGRGGMGEVYRARDSQLPREVAIKTLPADVASSPDKRARLEKEARSVAGLSHPHICTLLDHETEGGIDFLVMEHLEGETLAQRLERGPLPLDEALRYATHIASALETAHRGSVIHRDIKPGNVMLTGRGSRRDAHLLDFGIARFLPSAGLDTEATTLAGLTREGSILGTIAYMSPEQLRGSSADERSDLFSFGALLYEMVSGKRAFDGDTQPGVIAAILEHDPPLQAETLGETPASFRQLLHRCLAKDPDDRWQTATDLLRQLEWIGEGEASEPPAPPLRHEAPRRLRVAFGAGAVLFAVAIGSFVWLAILEPQHVDRPRDDRVHMELGSAYAGLGDKDKAIEHGEKGRDLMPMDSDAEGNFNLLRLASIRRHQPLS